MKKDIYQEQNITKAVLMGALPAMLGTVATLIYNIADTYFVSMTNDPAKIAAVTLSTPILLIIMSIANVFGSGGGSLIARYLGAGQKDKVRDTAAYCLYGSAISSLIICALGLVLPEPIARLCGADAENMAYTMDYLRYIFLGAPGIMIYNGMQNVFRSAGYIRQSTAGMVIGNGANVVLDFVFIVLLKMGTAGAALATSLGFLLSTIYFLVCMGIFLRRGDGLLPLSPKAFRPSLELTKGICQIGIPGALVTILLSISNIVLNNYIAKYSSDAVAAYGITYKIYLIPVMLTVGISMGIGPLVGFNYGSGNYDRMKKVLRTSNVFSFLVGALLLVLILAFGQVFTGVFLEDEALSATAARFLRTVCLASPLLGVTYIANAYFQAIGKAIPSLTITLMRNVVLFIACIVVFDWIWGLNGVIAAQPAVEIAMAVVSTIMCRVTLRKLTQTD